MTPRFEHHVRPAAELHALDLIGPPPPIDVRVVWCEPTSAALVLGSRQPLDTVDASACAAAGLAVVRRRSGGGAVLVDPASAAWIDIAAPHGALPDDIRGSMQWVGQRWREAILAVAPEFDESLSVHSGGMVETEWSSYLCFAGVGPGEIVVGGRKLVGLSQRRTRHGVRVQGMLYIDHPTVDVRGLFAGSVPDVPVPAVATLPGHAVSTLAEAITDAVARDLSQRPGD